MSDLMRRLEALLRAGPQQGPPARDPVNPPMIRHWCDAIGDRNPVYTDPEFASGSVHGGLVAPPTMLQAWTMPELSARPAKRKPLWRQVLGLLDEAGFSSVVATNCRQEYRRYLRPGDVITPTTRIAAVSEEKKTQLGSGHFVTQQTEYHDQHGELVARMEFRLLKFKPSQRPAPSATPARRPRPAVNQDTEFFWKGLREGRLLLRACTACQTRVHPPEPMCPGCRSLQWETVEASGRGHVHSYVVVHHPPLPPFEYPHAVALVELEEGVRVVAELRGVAPDAVRIGMPVEAAFEPADPDDELVVPRFRPSSPAS